MGRSVHHEKVVEGVEVGLGESLCWFVLGGAFAQRLNEPDSKLFFELFWYLVMPLMGYYLMLRIRNLVGRWKLLMLIGAFSAFHFLYHDTTTATNTTIALHIAAFPIAVIIWNMLHRKIGLSPFYKAEGWEVVLYFTLAIVLSPGDTQFSLLIGKPHLR